MTIEQSKPGGEFYLTTIVDDTKSSKQTVKTDTLSKERVLWGQPYQASFSVVNDQLYFSCAGYTYQYVNNTWQYVEQVLNGEPYYCGLALVDGVTYPYYVKDLPVANVDIPITAIEQMVPPHTWTGFPYESTFTLLPELVQLMYDIPATYVDRFKRPLNALMFDHHRYYPKTVKESGRTLGQLRQGTHFPCVVDLNQFAVNGVKFGILDLEPGYTQSDVEWLQSFDIVYEEETPRGGKHFLFRHTSDRYKYRLTPNLEILTNALVTLYGINGRMINPNAGPSTLDDSLAVDYNPIEVVTAESDVNQIVEWLMARNKGGLGRSNMQRRFDRESLEDMSKAEFNAMRHLYVSEIKMFESMMTESDVPWVLGEYARRVLPYRPKHDSPRKNVPYIVVTAKKVIEFEHHLQSEKETSG